MRLFARVQTEFGYEGTVVSRTENFIVVLFDGVLLPEPCYPETLKENCNDRTE